MANTYVNKVQLADGTVLLDVSSDTVAADKVLYGYTAHKADGSTVTGNIATKTSSDMTVNGGTVTAPGGYYASAQSKSVANGTITNNTSGGTSSGTVQRGKQVKIGAGYYSTDKYYTAQSNSGTKTVTASGVTSVDGYANVNVPQDCIVLDVTATSSTTKTIYNDAITSDFYVFNTASTVIGADVSWSTSSGSVTLSCTSGIPAMTIFLGRNF